MLLRRGHRLHSLHGMEPRPDLSGITRLDSTARSSYEEETKEQELWDAVQENDVDRVTSLGGRLQGHWPWRWSFSQDIITEAVRLGCNEMVVAVVTLLAAGSSMAYRVGEFAVVVATSSRDSQLVIDILELWLQNKGFQEPDQGSKPKPNNTSVLPSCSCPTTPKVPNSTLEIVAMTVTATATPHTPKVYYKKEMNTCTLAETAIYVATVDKLGEVLKVLLDWVKENREALGSSIEMLNADCIIHAALEGDKEQLRILYIAGYRLGPDTTRRVNKDYLKKIKLFRARASPTYCAVAFEQSQDLETDDPMKRCLEFSLQARHYASTIQDFNREYLEVSQKCDNFAIKLLDTCTTKHEIQTLLQTKSYRGHHDANFNIAILDGHKEIVAHEKFQQLLHKKWGQRDRVHYGDDIRYNIFWSEMGKLQKFAHFMKQVVCYFLLPLVFLLTMFLPMLEKYRPINTIIMQSHIPVNRFIYYEMSKVFFCLLIFVTLVQKEDDVALALDVLCVVWIFSYILEDFRTIYRLVEQGPADNKAPRTVTIRRWLTFRNVLILVTNMIFLVSLILRFLAYQENQCRTLCPYEGNKMAFIGGCLWGVAALLTFLRTIQTGLMYRQTGPIIISMSYMIVDVCVFLFVFVIVYISFTLSTVYIYSVYDDDRTQFFNDHKTAFKLFYWTLIRTGNPHFPNIREFNSTLHYYNATCLSSSLDGGDRVPASSVAGCALGKDGMVGEFDSDIEEGVPYITGNILWAVYQFIVFIVLLSVLRARMVNTYHRIFREADVQWKFFRASIWWKYFDHNSFLPPPFTTIFLMYSAVRKLRTCHPGQVSSLDKEQKEDLSEDQYAFNKRYKRLLLTLVQSEENSWGFDISKLKKTYRSSKSVNSSNSAEACGGD